MTGARRVFHPSAPEGFEWAIPINDEDFEVFSRLSERTPGDVWRPIEMRFIKDDDHGRLKQRADMPWLGSHVLILRDEAIEAVGSLLRPHGELLPLRCDEARLVVFSAPLIKGALDEEHSDILRFRDGGIMRIRRTALREAAVKDVLAFKFQEMPRGYVYLAEPLVEAILATGMTAGTNFVEVT